MPYSVVYQMDFFGNTKKLILTPEGALVPSPEKNIKTGGKQCRVFRKQNDKPAKRQS